MNSAIPRPAPAGPAFLSAVIFYSTGKSGALRPTVAVLNRFARVMDKPRPESLGPDKMIGMAPDLMTWGSRVALAKIKVE